ncbi:MAG: hypothetical protein AAF560_17410, partial [Acidobacteriota bacterium]
MRPRFPLVPTLHNHSYATVSHATVSYAATVACCLLVLASLLPGAASASANGDDAALLSPSEVQLQQHLEHLDRWLQQTSRVERTATEQQRLQRHLLALERRVNGWDSPHGERWRTALQVLQRKVSRQQESRVQAKDSALSASPGVHLKATPANDDCADATTIGNGTFTGDTSMATPDGSAGCGFSDSSPDVWFRYSTPIDSNVFVDTIGSEFDTVLAV